MASYGQRPALRDVAARAGVSVKTASRVLNGEPGVRPARAARVRKAIADLGYVPNEAARQLRRGAPSVAEGGLKAAPAAALWDGQPPSGVATRARNGLDRKGIRTIGELLAATAAELAGGNRHFGGASLAEVRRVLAARGLALKGDPQSEGGCLRDARGLPYEVVTDGAHVVIVTGSGALRLGMEEREAFEAAYKQALAEVDHGH